jgi:N-acetylglutamate synthase-like GNAT family acetyltransferase
VPDAPTIRRVPAGDPAVARVVAHWGTAVARGDELVDPTAQPGLVAERRGEVVGAATYAVRGDECEVVTVDASPPGTGTGRALLDALVAVAREAGCSRLWLVTTNDNLRALRVYQQFGFTIEQVALGAVDEARRARKPSIPRTGAHGIPIRHEFRLELPLA